MTNRLRLTTSPVLFGDLMQLTPSFGWGCSEVPSRMTTAIPVRGRRTLSFGRALGGPALATEVSRRGPDRLPVLQVEKYTHLLRDPAAMYAKDKEDSVFSPHSIVASNVVSQTRISRSARPP